MNLHREEKMINTLEKLWDVRWDQVLVKSVRIGKWMENTVLLSNRVLFIMSVGINFGVKHLPLT